jgi:hypothetical protein
MIRQITRIPGAALSTPSGGWEDCGVDEFHTDMALLGHLRELARRSVSDPGCSPELEALRTLREVPAADVRFVVRRVERSAPRGWRLAGDDGEDVHDRIDRHFAIPQERALGILA